jgi:hypothetical protein
LNINYDMFKIFLCEIFELQVIKDREVDLKYAEDQEGFFKDYAEAHAKLSILGALFEPPEVKASSHSCDW